MKCEIGSNQAEICDIFRSMFQLADRLELVAYFKAEKLVGSMKYRSIWSTNAP